MSKSILVLDTSEYCRTCSLADYDSESRGYWCRLSDYCYKRKGVKPRWCQLSLLPDKIVSDTEYAQGWNDCIDYILKEKTYET